MRRYLFLSFALCVFSISGIYELYAGEPTAIGISFEKSMIFDNQINGINYTKLTLSKFYMEKGSFQISAGGGISNNFDDSKLSEIINGRIKAFEFDFSFRGHFFSSQNHKADYYLIFGLNIEALYWKYREAFEVYDEYGYGENEYKDGTTGVGFYWGVGLAAFITGDLKLSFESQPGLIILSNQTHNGFTRLLDDMYYLKFNFSIAYDPK
jgi:hypothetical protein